MTKSKVRAYRRELCVTEILIQSIRIIAPASIDAHQVRLNRYDSACSASLSLYHNSHVSTNNTIPTTTCHLGCSIYVFHLH